MRPAGARKAPDHVGAAGHARQKRRVDRGEERERRGLALARVRATAVDDLGGQLERRARPRPGCGSAAGGSRTADRAPAARRAAASASTCGRPARRCLRVIGREPRGVVEVTARRSAAARAAHEREQIFEQHVDRDAVGDDVVHVEREVRDRARHARTPPRETAAAASSSNGRTNLPRRDATSSPS